jgi:hypothetical protein
MIAVRMFKKLDQALPGMSELDPLIGKYVQILVMEEEEPAPEAPTATAAADAVVAPPVVAQPIIAPPVERPVTRRRLRVCGTVDRVGDNGEAFRLCPDPDSAVPCTWAGEGPSPAIGAAGRKLAIAGTGIFDETGTLLRVDVKSGAPAHPNDARFARIPRLNDEEPPEIEAAAPDEESPVLESPAQVAAALPLEPPRPALSAATSFTAIFGREADE